MGKICLFIAMSLDGYIADKEGKVDWLEGQGKNDDNIDSYAEFSKNIDIVLMGWNTYNQIITELSPDKWIYDDFKTYVLTHKRIQSTENICFTNEQTVTLVKRLLGLCSKNIWICGGANIVQQLVKENLIDIYYIIVIPTILGGGIRLFEQNHGEIKLRLLKTKSYNGMTDLIYEKR